MILKEKKLCRVMAGRYKDEGYSVTTFQENGDIYLGIRSGGWAVVCEWSNVPRKVLATIVEHAGALPGAGQAWLLEEDMEPQTEDFEMAAEEFRMLMAYLDEAEPEKLCRTPLHMGIFRLWQNVQTGAIWRVNPAFTAMAAPAENRITVAGACLCMSGNLSAVFVDRASETEGDAKLIEHLQKVRWA